MRTLAILLCLAGAIHLYLDIPALAACLGALVLWVVWQAKWVILGVLGLGMLFGGDGDSGA